MLWIYIENILVKHPPNALISESRQSRDADWFAADLAGFWFCTCTSRLPAFYYTQQISSVKALTGHFLSYRQYITNKIIQLCFVILLIATHLSWTSKHCPTSSQQLSVQIQMFARLLSFRYARYVPCLNLLIFSLLFLTTCHHLHPVFFLLLRLSRSCWQLWSCATDWQWGRHDQCASPNYLCRSDWSVRTRFLSTFQSLTNLWHSPQQSFHFKRVSSSNRPKHSATRQACSVWLKNRVYTCYTLESPNPRRLDLSPIQDSDRDALRQSILPLLANSPSRSISVQLSHTLKNVIAYDLPNKKWLTLADEIKLLLASTDVRQVHAGCLAALEAIRAFRSVTLLNLFSSY